MTDGDLEDGDKIVLCVNYFIWNKAAQWRRKSIFRTGDPFLEPGTSTYVLSLFLLWSAFKTPCLFYIQWDLVTWCLMYSVSSLSSVDKWYPLGSTASRAFRPLAEQMSSYQLTSGLSHRQTDRQTNRHADTFCNMKLYRLSSRILKCLLKLPLVSCSDVKDKMKVITQSISFMYLR